MTQQMDVFLQSETKNFVEMLFNVVDTKEYMNVNTAPMKGEPNQDSIETSKILDDTIREPKIEADSTTPIREPEKFNEPKPSYDEREDRKRSYRDSPPPYERRLAGRLGQREPRRYRSKSRSRTRSLSPRHDRFRSSRRRSPPGFRGGRLARSPGRPRGRSLERERDGTPTRDEGTGYTPTVKVRCRDYDEKGFCLRGDSCKFDHGNGKDLK